MDDSYDVVVVGGGLGGLTTAAFLSKAGMKTLLVEQGTGLGGYAHTFQRGDYTFDPAVHVTNQGKDGEFYDGMLRKLDVRDQCELIPVEPPYGVTFPDMTFAPRGQPEPYIESHVERFPAAATGIRDFFDVCTRVHREAHAQPPQLGLAQLDDLVKYFPTLFKYSKATVDQVLDDYLEDPQARSACTAAWPYVGLPPSQLSFLTFAQLMFGGVLSGTYYCKGSFQRLVDALATAVTKHGGEIAVSTPVTRIEVADGRVTGVELATGEVIRCRAVVSNADARETFEKLVGEEHLPAPFMKRLRRMSPSLSAFVLFTATTMTLDHQTVPHEMFHYRHWDHDATYEDILAGRPGGMWVSFPTLADPSLAPQGENLAILTSLAAWDIGRSWEEEKERFQESLLEELERMFPGFGQTLTYVESATPQTLHLFTRNQNGAAYGWAYTPQQTGSKRLSHQSPIGGLYLSGHWTQPGAVSLRVCVSGVHAAQLVLRDIDQGVAPDLFDIPDFPPV